MLRCYDSKKQNQEGWSSLHEHFGGKRRRFTTPNHKQKNLQGCRPRNCAQKSFALYKTAEGRLAFRDNLAECLSALRAHKLRACLTMLGLTIGVATLITVMTIVQGANLYVESKVANLGTNVFQIARTPFAVTDFNIIIKALKYKKIEIDDVRAIQEGCPACDEVGATASASVKARYEDKESTDVNFLGQTANMTSIDTREVQYGRYFTSWEADHRASVCLIGDTIVQRLL